jgi:MoxR-like ATPase
LTFEGESMSFEDVSQALNRLVGTVAEVYRGYHQHAMIEAVFCGLLMGEPVLLIGSHGTLKTSMANFVGKLFDKPVVTVSETFSARGKLEGFFEDLGETLGVEGERLQRNLVDGVHVGYEQVGKAVKVTVEVDAVKHPNAEKLGEPRRKPIEVFSMQVNDQMDPEDVLGYGIDHPAVLGLKPPHAVKAGRLAGADYVVLDEIFMAPRLLAKLHHALNEKVTDTVVGPVEVKPLGWVLCTNPLNQFYQANVKIVNAATLDRYALSARSMPPSAQEILTMAERWRQLKLKKRAPVELIYEARRLMEEVAVPEEFTIFCLGLVSHLSRCYFSTAKGRRADESKDPFEAERDCSLCIYGRRVPMRHSERWKSEGHDKASAGYEGSRAAKREETSGRKRPSVRLGTRPASQALMEQPGVPKRARKHIHRHEGPCRKIRLPVRSPTYEAEGG